MIQQEFGYWFVYRLLDGFPCFSVGFRSFGQAHSQVDTVLYSLKSFFLDFADQGLGRLFTTCAVSAPENMMSLD